VRRFHDQTNRSEDYKVPTQPRTVCRIAHPLEKLGPARLPRGGAGLCVCRSLARFLSG
jgi:hypothetical protein